MLVFLNCRLVTMDIEGDIANGFLAVEEDKIVAVGSMEDFAIFRLTLDSSLHIQTIDLQNQMVVPGFIDIHSHLGLFNDGLAFEGDDGNENTEPITPHIRGLDGVYIDNTFQEAYKAGVALVMTGPGSANVLGGQFSLMKTYEKIVDKALVVDVCAQKAALGENPKSVYGKENKMPASRMATAALLRETLMKAVDYDKKWVAYETQENLIFSGFDSSPFSLSWEQMKSSQERDMNNISKRGEDEEIDKPDFDMVLDSLRLVVQRKIPLKIHCHRQDDICTAVRICKEFNLIYTLDHCTEGYLVADYLREEYDRGVKNPNQSQLLGVIVGPVLVDRSKPELAKSTLATASLLKKANVPVAIMTDHPCVPQQYLALSSSYTINKDLNWQDAIEAITSKAAQISGIWQYYGSLHKGKQADFVVFSGDPFHYQSKVKMFVGSGKIIYNLDNM